KSGDIESFADQFLNEELGVNSLEEAFAGARDIIAEAVAEDAEVRAQVRKVFLEKGNFVSRVVPGKEESALKYKDYFEWPEPLDKAPSHRVLAMRRGEKEELLYLDIEVEEELVIPKIEKVYLKGNNEAAKQVELALYDGYKRLLKPSMET